MSSQIVQPQLFDSAPQHARVQEWHDEMLQTLHVEPGPAWPDRFGRAMLSWFTEQNHRSIRTLSLFSGGGGLDIAFHQAGFEILEMVEIEERFAATLSANAEPGGMLDGGSVRCIDIRNYEPRDDLEVDFIIGGPPCQTFSAAGRRAAGVKGTTDPRGTLFEEYVRLLQRLRPKGFLFENVYGITGAEGGDPWREIQDAFRASGYTIHFRVLDAADYGVPQHRERLFIVGLRSDVAQVAQYKFPRPTHGPDAMPPRAYYSAGEAIIGADPNDETSLEMNGRWGHLIAGIPPGLNYSYYTREMGHPTPVFGWRSKFSDFMYKADPEYPVRTVKAQGGAYTGPFSWKNRHFSTAEMKRLQTFPDEYLVVGKRQARIHQLGNSVPPQIGRIMALSILNQVFGVDLPFSMHYLAENELLGFRTRKRLLTERYAAKARLAIASLEDTSTSEPTTYAAREVTTRYLTDKFSLSDSPNEGSLAVELTYASAGEKVLITGRAVHPDNGTSIAFAEEGFRFGVEVEPVPGVDWHLPLRHATLIGSGGNPLLQTALWKALEELIVTRYGVDDLVQLSGYYQYAPKMRARMTVESSESIATVWHILKQVAQGQGVALQMSADILSEVWEISLDDVIPALHDLRRLGYEVRNSNTNPQIQAGKYLIPYAFPTLTPRSVQLRKNL